MNIDRLNKLINVMQRQADEGRPLYLGNWQGLGDDPDEASVAQTEEELHSCGTAACVAGYLAVSPEYQNDGGTCSHVGAPKWSHNYGGDAIAAYLSCPVHVSNSICGHSCIDEEVGLCGDADNDNHYNVFYRVKNGDVTPAIVVARLIELRETGE